MVCKKCGKELTQEMIDVNLCWSCGDIINKSVDEQEQKAIDKEIITENEPYDKMQNATNNKNAIGTILKFLGIAILVLGTIGSIVLADGEGRYYGFAFSVFVMYEFATVLAGFLLIGFSEIIQLLNKISNKRNI